MPRKQTSQPAGAAAPRMPTPAEIKVHQIKQRAAPLLNADQFELAASLLEEVLPLSRRDGMLHKMLGFAYSNMQRIDKGRFHLRRAVELGVTDPETMLCLAAAHRDAGDLRAALRITDDILKKNPRHANAIHFKAWIMRSLGDAEGALGLIDKALADGSYQPNLSFIRAEILRRFKRYGDAIDELTGLQQNPSVSAVHRRDALYGLANTYDAMGDYDSAFEALERANATLDAGTIIPFEEFLAVWSKEAIDAMPESEETTDLPVFVVGMPRSGTTLTEQILGAHPRIVAIGESPAMTMLARDRFAADYDAEAIRGVASGYLERINPSRFPKAARIVDKMPENFYFLPVIRKALPNASLIHCTRDARDTCLSCLFQHFGNRLAWTRRQTTCAQQYVLYRRIMDHWAEVLDMDLLENRYEDLTSDPEPRIRRMLEHVRMPFDDACLAHHKQKGNVQTASVDQVRKPIYTSSQQRWKRYEKHLGPMLEILEGY